MADVQYWRDQIISEIEEIRAISSSIPNQLDDLNRTLAIDSAEKKIRNAKGNCRSLKAEIRIVADPEESSRYKKELKGFESTLGSLSSDIQGMKSDQSRNRLFLGANGGGDGEDGADGTDPTAAGDSLLDGAERIQDKTQAGLSNITKMIGDTKAVGTMNLEELERQRNQIQNVDQNVVRLEDNLNRADKLIKTFGKRMATDKLIQMFACVNILLIVGVVVYSIIKGGIKRDAQNAPESPIGGGTSNNNNVDSVRMLRGVW